MRVAKFLLLGLESVCDSFGEREFLIAALATALKDF
jgi:hypothetical protein